MEKGYTIPVLDHGYVRYIDHMGTDERIVEAARISYKSPSKGKEQDKRLLSYLYKMRHTSPFEQCSITFDIKLPLFVQGQMVRHRTQKLNQISARYTEMDDCFYIPKQWRKQDIQNKQGSLIDNSWEPAFEWRGEIGDGHNDCSLLFKEACKDIYESYKIMINSGVSKEMARMILPQNLYTEIYSNWDLHNLMHFFRLRLDKHAQWEIQQYAKAMYEIFSGLYPWCSEAYEKFSWELKES